MQCKLNGTLVDIADGTTLKAYLKEQGFDEKVIVVEYNKEVLARGAYETTRLTEGDQLEILSFVGGG